MEFKGFKSLKNKDKGKGKEKNIASDSVGFLGETERCVWRWRGREILKGSSVGEESCLSVDLKAKRRRRGGSLVFFLVWEENLVAVALNVD